MGPLQRSVGPARRRHLARHAAQPRQGPPAHHGCLGLVPLLSRRTAAAAARGGRQGAGSNLLDRWAHASLWRPAARLRRHHRRACLPRPVAQAVAPAAMVRPWLVGRAAGAACSLQPRAQPQAATPCTQAATLCTQPACSPMPPARRPMPHHGCPHHGCPCGAALRSGARTRRARVCWESSAASPTAWRGTRTVPTGGATRKPKAVQTSSRRAEALQTCAEALQPCAGRGCNPAYPRCNLTHSGCSAACSWLQP